MNEKKIIMQRLVVPLLCVWALLEPPYKNNAPVLDAPFKEWKIASFTRDKKISIPYYFDSRKDCEERRKGLAFGDEKVCLPVNPVLTQ